VEYPVLDFFQAPTVRAMAAHIRRMADAGRSSGPERVRGTL
jgi:hypothetical protein